jgi:spore coat polysaccharide biosynthesis protein SpsF (cytidylyltransferase family)
MRGKLMKTAIFLSIREKATRLPKKVLLEIKGKTVTEHLIDRLKQAKLPDMIVMCTSTHPDDNVLVEIAEKNNIEYFRGSEEDKLDRYLQAAKKFGIDFMLIVDGDDIFCDPIAIDNIIRKFEDENADYIKYKDLPLGATAHGVKYEALEKVCEIKAENDTEVWGGYFTKTGLFNYILLEAEEEFRHPEIRMTLDYKEDFDFFNAIFKRLYKPGEVFSLRKIINLVERYPEIPDLNKGVQKKYLKKIDEAHKKMRIKSD